MGGATISVPAVAALQSEPGLLELRPSLTWVSTLLLLLLLLRRHVAAVVAVQQAARACEAQENPRVGSPTALTPMASGLAEMVVDRNCGSLTRNPSHARGCKLED